jgi:NADPH:quinone reductase
MLGQVVAREKYTLMPVPKHLRVEEATSIWMQYMTAWGGLMAFGELKAGETIVITAASSSAGVDAIQLAKDAGAHVIATTRTAAKRDFVAPIGADHVIVTDEEDLGARVKSLTGVRRAVHC